MCITGISNMEYALFLTGSRAFGDQVSSLMTTPNSSLEFTLWPSLNRFLMNPRTCTDKPSQIMSKTYIPSMTLYLYELTD